MTQVATFEPVSNREDWVEQVEVRDQTNTLVDLTGGTIVFSLRERTSKRTMLTASTDDGNLVIQAVGVFEFTFPVAQMRGLDASKQYEVGCTLLLNGRTQQVLIGSVPVIDGIVP